jgi:hypothetical protein
VRVSVRVRVRAEYVLLFGSFTSAPTAPAYYLCASAPAAQRRVAVLVVRGTDSFEDCITDLQVSAACSHR